MTTLSFIPETDWRCAACDEPLRPKVVTVVYLGHDFAVELLTCPVCGLTYVPEDLALGKMFEVEQLLEDK